MTDRPRINQVLLTRVSMGALGVLAAVFFVSALLIRPEIEFVDGERRIAQADRDLNETLQRLRSAWDDRERQRILQEAPRQTHLAGAVRRLLSRWKDPLTEQAIQYAGALEVAELRPDVAAWAVRGRHDVRAQAVRAAERLGPWPADELVQLLGSGLPPVQVAALEVAAGRADVPWTAVLELLRSDHAEVRAAAVAAVPGRPAPEAVQALWAMVEHGSPEAAVVGLDTLARTELVAELEAAVNDLLPDAVPEVQLAALDFLAAKGAPLADPVPVQELVWNLSADLHVRARALHCLEQTGSHDVEQLRRRIYAMEPLLQYFAARCLLEAGQPDGAQVLVDLLDADASEEAVVASRQLLAGLTGLSPGATADEFRECLAGRAVPARVLPEPGVRF